MVLLRAPQQPAMRARDRVVWVFDPRNGYAVVGGFVYRGKAVTAARGRYFYGDDSSGRIWSLRVVHGRPVQIDLTILRDQDGERSRRGRPGLSGSQIS
jgi:hypothetical protein